MHNNNNRSGEHSLKAILKSSYSITDRAQSKLYLHKMQTVRKAVTGSNLIQEQSTLIATKPSLPSLKQQFDSFAKGLFKRLDFDCGGFISSSKIAHDKALPESVFYFFGGVFQKVRQMGAVTEKLFMALCEQLYLHASQSDLQLLLGNAFQRGEAEGVGKKKKGKGSRLARSCTTLKHQKSVSKMETTAKHELTPLRESKMANSTLSKKDSLKKFLQSASKPKPKSKHSASQPKSQPKQESIDVSYLQQTQKMRESSNFDSLRVKKLTEKLDRQILQSQTRINLNQYLR